MMVHTHPHPNANWVTHAEPYADFQNALLDLGVGLRLPGTTSIRGWSTEKLTEALDRWHHTIESVLFYGNSYLIKYVLPQADGRIKELRAELTRRATPLVIAADSAPTIKGYWDASEVRAKVDPLDIFAQYLPDINQKRGPEYTATCPFHKAKSTGVHHTPSMGINVEKGVFRCYACQAGGSMFDFVMRLDNLAFPEAVNRVAELGNL